MKRVIVLSWFNTLMNRLFGPDDNSKDEVVYEEPNNDYEVDDPIEQPARKQNSAFRFPIVSDAEIYGWDENSTVEREVSQPTTNQIDADYHYEPTPLYENERWPGDPKVSNVFRAGSTPKYGASSAPQKTVFVSRDKELQKEQTAQVKTPIQKRSSRPFSPTSVPSPVYGYKHPAKEVPTKSDEDVVQSPQLEEAAVMEPIIFENQLVEQQIDLPREDEQPILTPPILEMPVPVIEPNVGDSSVDEADAHQTELERPAMEPINLENHLVEQQIDLPSEDEQPTLTPPTLETPVSVIEPNVGDSSVDEVDSHQKELERPAMEPIVLEKHLVEQQVVLPTEDEQPILTPPILETPVPVVEPNVGDSNVDVMDSHQPELERPAVEPIGLENLLEKQQIVLPTEDEQPILTPPILETPVPVIEPNVGDSRLDEVDSHQTELERPAVEPDVSDQQEDVVELESPVIDSAELEHTKDTFPPVETEVIVDDAELTEEPILEQKKERIVPFNVLMLKSDKEKVMREQPFQASVAIEKISEMIGAPNNPKIVHHEVKEVSQEIQQPSVIDEKIEELPYYAFPSLDDLIPPEAQIEDTEWLDSQSEKLEEALSHFAVQATVIEAVQGPTVTRFELTVGQGTKVSKVRNLTDDLKLALAAEDIRIQAPIPGRSSIGIEIPNRKTRAVRISEVIATESFQASTSPLEAVLGLSLTGKPVTLDLRKMPHGMIAGATGSGKSVCINSILVSLLYKAAPTDLKMMLIDPKMVELAPFNGIPHLISPVITDVKAATAALKWAVAEMERRYELLAHAGVRDIERYNKVVMENRRYSLKMPYLLIVIDELADLMMMAPADVEVSISRIAQKARACGIHLIIATQRPSVDVITGTIKANIPTRIAFSVSSQIDSRTIIDSPGAERLLGRGDMLYIGNGQSSGVRLQGTFVTDDEIERIIEHVRNEAAPNYLFGQDDLLASAVEEEETDSLFEEACQFVHEQGSASTSLLQRNFSIGYNRAAKLIDRMEKNGFISGQRGSKARDVFLSESDLDRLMGRLD
ncbi:DNA translocase FtsK [Sporosarcina sp. NPDC096371]|uniref:DNA translocase FtsK n=1 Tax=Sporosarcina sp. NPDC096371 TaxID=3364530 RepID=UPI00381141FC